MSDKKKAETLIKLLSTINNKDLSFLAACILNYCTVDWNTFYNELSMDREEQLREFLYQRM